MLREGSSIGPADILAMAHNVNSQFGEDGIIGAILEKLPTRNFWCVEFGAWDGKYLSNTRQLIDAQGYSAVLIEANTTSFGQLERNLAGNPRVQCLNAFVGFGEQDNLDRILADTQCPKDFDLLSIDIDGNDIHVWAAMRTWRPKIVCIEFNPTIPTPVKFMQPAEPGLKLGSSLRAIFDLGTEKGYRLVCANEVNAFFVAEEYWDGDFARSDLDLPRFRKVEPPHVYLFSGYDGTVMLSEVGKLGWHPFEVKSRDVQVLPRILRRFPDDYSRLQRTAMRLLRRIRS